MWGPGEQRVFQGLRGPPGMSGMRMFRQNVCHGAPLDRGQEDAVLASSTCGGRP